MNANYLTVDEAAEFAGVSTRTIRRWISAGVLPAKRMGPHFVRIGINDLRSVFVDIEPTVTK